MKKINSILLILPLILVLGCQSSKVVETTVPNLKFPEDWAGNWEGQLEIHNGGGKTMDLKMGLNIAPVDSGKYTFTILYYGKNGTDERLYELLTVDARKGHYQVDEKNSIVLDDYFFMNKLYSRFEVMGNLLLVTYELRGEEMIFEVISGKMGEEHTVITGGQDSIPKVTSYPIQVMQRGIMKRK